MLSVDQEDSIGNHRLDIHDTLSKKRTSHTMAPINEPTYVNGEIDPEKVAKAITDGEGCNIIGFIPISKVPGDIHVSFHGYADIFSYFKHVRADLYPKISLNHRLISLNFGNTDLNERILSRFGLESSAFKPETYPNYQNEKQRKNYDYFIKLIPHLFIDHTRGETYTGYQYSMTSRAREYEPDGNEMPIVYVHYDLSPITMKYTLQSKSFLHSLTHICAIVGGIYVIFNLINRVLLSLCDFTGSDKKGVSASG